ncbi:hypothetical protein [Sphingobium ummariense]|uniref:hypothetical protein n=1 Tax=Sphingobium ummariense TaxID=420994 RepID=UPI00126979CC|nr:hypothetical protein [Sphingobium ummariense]
MRIVLIFVLLSVTGCDQLSQRIWNCAAEPLQVTKVLDDGRQVSDVIPAHGYIASMNGGAQVIALKIGHGANGRNIWRREQSQPGLATSSSQICGRAKWGVVAEQL